MLGHNLTIFCQIFAKFWQKWFVDDAFNILPKSRRNDLADFQHLGYCEFYGYGGGPRLGCFYTQPNFILKGKAVMLKVAHS